MPPTTDVGKATAIEEWAAEELVRSGEDREAGPDEERGIGQQEDRAPQTELVLRSEVLLAAGGDRR